VSAAGAPPAGRPGRIVEFVGLPGSGKSTVSHAVAAILRASGRPVTERSFEIAHRVGGVGRRLAKLRLAARTLLRHPGAALALVRLVARTRQRSRIEAIVKTLDFLYVCGLIAGLSRRSGIHLLDQGFLTGIWSIDFGAGLSAPHGRLIDLGARCCGGAPADLVVILEVQPALAMERLKQRPGAASRLEKSLTLESRDRDLQKAIVTLERVRQAIEAGGRPWRVQVSPGDEAVATAALAEAIAAGAGPA
jgi:thymidylate kinase